MTKIFYRKYGIKNYLIIALTLLAITLAILIYLKNSNFKKQFNDQPSSSIADKREFDASDSFIENPNLTKEEKQALKIPIGGTDAEKQEHFQLAIKIAKTTDTIEISNCHPQPIVAKINKNEKAVFKNSDSKDHTIIIGLKDIFKIPAKSKKEIDFSFKNEAGKLFGYGCDSSPSAAGLLFII